MAHWLAPLLGSVGAHGAGQCVPGAPCHGWEIGGPDAEPAGGDAGLGLQPQRHTNKLPSYLAAPQPPAGTGMPWYAAQLGSDPHSLAAFGTGVATTWLALGSPRDVAYSGQVEGPQCA